MNANNQSLIQNIDSVAWYIVNNKIDDIKKIIHSGNTEALFGVNQFGDSYYTISKRLGYDELANLLKENLKIDTQESSSKISPVKVFYDHTDHDYPIFFKAFEYFALHPTLSKIMLPVALEMHNKKEFIFTGIPADWLKGADEFALKGLMAALVDFHSLEDKLKSFKSLFINPNIKPSYHNEANKFLFEFYLKYEVSKGIIYKDDFKDYYKFESILIHEITHYAMRILFNNKGLPYFKHNKNQDCSGVKYKNDLYIFTQLLEVSMGQLIKEFIQEEDLATIRLNQLIELIPEESVLTTKLNIVGTETFEEYTFTGSCINMIAAFLDYPISEKRVEAIVLYPSAVAEGIMDENMTIFSSQKDHFEKCILGSIDEFVLNHSNCNDLLGVDACND